MWAPALGVLVTRKTVDKEWKPWFRLLSWGRPRWWVILFPIGASLGIYGLAQLAGTLFGHSLWDPHWKSTGKIVVNLLVNGVIIAVVGGIGALGEEIGWRGYLQPRLDDAGVRFSIAWVAGLWTIFHIPIMVFGGYLETGGAGKFLTVLGLFAITNIPESFLWAWACTRARSLWPAVWFHCYHNWFSQFVFPKLFSGHESEIWMGEHGLFATAAHLLAGLLLWLWLKKRGKTWTMLADETRQSSQGRAS